MKILHKRKTHLAAEKIFVFHHSLKINKRGYPNKLRGGRGSEKHRKINKHRPLLPFMRHLRVKILLIMLSGNPFSNTSFIVAFSFC